MTLMTLDYDNKKFASDKIALLALFIISLLIAQTIVKVRGRVKLSDPIPLNGTGLSISLPKGDLWQSSQAWNYKNSKYTLNSILRSTSASAPQLQCTYSLAEKPMTTQERIDEKAKIFEGNVISTEKINVNGLTLETANIEISQTPVDIQYAFVLLEDQRLLEIEFYYLVQDSDIVDNAFDQIVKSITFKNDSLIQQAGARIVTQIRQKGIPSFLESGFDRKFFLVLQNGNEVGFTMDVIRFSLPDAIVADNFFYLKNSINREITATLESNPDFTILSWRGQKRDASTIEEHTLTFTEGIIELTDRMTGEQQILYPRPEILPDAFMLQFLEEFLASDYDRALVDMFEAQGEITPTIFSKHPEQSRVTVEFVGSHLPSQHIYLDKDNQIEKIELVGQNVELIRASMNEIITKFPERADFVIEKTTPKNEPGLLTKEIN